MKRAGVGIFTTALVLAVAAALTSVPSQAQRRVGRQSGPRDWSHSRVIATRFGPDLDRNLAKNWRTSMKHAQLEQAQALRSPVGGWFQALSEPPASGQRGENAMSREQIEVNRRDAGVDTAGNRARWDAYQQASRTSSPHLDWNLRTGGFGSVVGSPAKYNFNITSSNCSDEIYFTVDQAGAASTVNVIGITNAYAGCTGNAAGATPTVKFGIRMGTGTATSAVPSLDGNVLYVIESRATGGVILHAINVDMITTSPGTYNFSTQVWSNAHVLATAPTGITSEQLFQITFPTTVANNLASPYLDYDTNQLFFGDSSGKVHKVVNVNLPTAARDTTNFPVSCGTAALQSPVFVNGQIIVTSADGRLYRIDTTKAPPYTCIAAARAGSGSGVEGGLSAPVVDVSNNKIFITTNDADGFGVAGIGIFNLMFTANQAAVSGAQLGAGTSTAPTSPSFDNAFWSTNNGNVYAAGSPTGGGNTYLVRFPYNGTTVGTATGFAALTRSGGASTVATSPVTEFLTASALSNPDFIFVGGGGGNYKFMNRIGSGFGGSDTSPASMGGSFAVPGGVISGIIIDTRTAGVTGSMATANIYFGTVGVASTTQSTIVQLAQQF